MLPQSMEITKCPAIILHFIICEYCVPGILRYRVDFQGMEYQGEDDEFFDLDDY